MLRSQLFVLLLRCQSLLWTWTTFVFPFEQCNAFWMHIFNCIKLNLHTKPYQMSFKIFNICIKTPVFLRSLQWYYAHISHFFLMCISLLETEETGAPLCFKTLQTFRSAVSSGELQRIMGSRGGAYLASVRPWRAMAGKRPCSHGDTETLCSSDTVKLMIPLHP